VIPSHQAGRDGYSVLYVEENPVAQKDTTAPPVIFRSIGVSALPGAFLRDFHQDGRPDWRVRHHAAKSQPHLHVVVSTASGTGLARSVWEQLVKPLFDCVNFSEGHDFALHLSTSETTVMELVRDVFLPRANEGTAQAILLLSGDGGMVDMVNAILARPQSEQYRKPVVALLPLGTGNALAHSAGLTNDNTMGLHAWLQGSAKELPLFRASFSPGARLLVNEGREERDLHVVNGTPVAHGAVVASWGLHATLVADSDTTEYRRFGAERFKMAGEEALFPSNGSSPHAYKGKVSVLQLTTDGPEQWQAIDRSEHGYVLATLVSHLEKGFAISPESKPLDGKLHLVHFGPASGKEAMGVMMAAYDGGRHIGNERVRYQQIDGFRVEFQEEDAWWRRVCIDGKIVRVEKGGWMEVRGGVKGVVDLVVM